MLPNFILYANNLNITVNGPSVNIHFASSEDLIFYIVEYVYHQGCETYKRF